MRSVPARALVLLSIALLALLSRREVVTAQAPQPGGPQPQVVGQSQEPKPKAVDGEALVRVKGVTTQSQAQTALSGLGLQVLEHYDFVGVSRVRVSAARPLSQIAAQ